MILKKLITFICVICFVHVALDANSINVSFSKDSIPQVIPKEIYGHFAEHLGRCIYDGIWVGTDSGIPNINGYRKDIGVGNESWGCGGDITPGFYTNLYRQYSGYGRLYTPDKIVRVACGTNSWDVNWIDVVMKNAGIGRMEAISLHYYTIAGEGWHDKALH